MRKEAMTERGGAELRNSPRFWEANIRLQYFQAVLIRLRPGETEESHEKPNSWESISDPKFKPGTSRTRSGSADHATTTFRARLTLQDLQIFKFEKM
jgi:hypothetical protein